MSLVVSCSATLAWVYGDETTAVRAVFESVGSGGAWVPALWRLEVANVLEMGVRRSRHDGAFRDATCRIRQCPSQLWGAAAMTARSGTPR